MSGYPNMSAWERFWKPTRDHYERVLEEQESQEAEIQAERENEINALEEYEDGLTETKPEEK